MPETIGERLESESASVAWRTGMSWCHSTQGREDEARALLAHVCDDDLGRLPNAANRPACLAQAAEAGRLLGEGSRGAAIEGALGPLAERNIGNARAVSFYGSAHCFLAKLAELRGDRAAAVCRYEAAATRNAELRGD